MKDPVLVKESAVHPKKTSPVESSSTKDLNLVQAVNLGLRQEMQRDDRVIVLGEDVGVNGGVFRVTEGLQKEFGESRVVDTPLAELGIVGASIGLAMYGLRPVAEIQFDGFLPPIFDQIISHAGRMRSRSLGRFTVPMVVRSPHGGLVHAPEHHSESPEAYFAHTPGIKVVIPSNPYDAKGLIVSAIRDPDPVIFFEPKRIYRSVKAPVPQREYTVPIGQAQVVRPGKEVTLIAWGAMVHTCLQAAAYLSEEHVEVEVVDLRTLAPLDLETILESVSRTGRAVIAQEAPRTCSLGSEISALIHERALLKLQAPVVRVTGYDVPTPLYKLEKYYFPDVDRVVRGIRETLKF
ncbi:MAG: alpha-ketoacid dehydrogenase subunit beta [Elusimicrobia bacterium]|nr:alpha-ketoacid dehydrogenase subunit beta [Elusimicrobiota bacterium]